VNAETLEKRRATNNARYGVPSPLMRDDFKEKAKATRVKKYGVEHALQSPEIEARRQATMVERYGAPHMLQVPELRDKMQATCLERYGVTNPTMNPELLAKARKTFTETCVEKYGSPRPRFGKAEDELAECVNSWTGGLPLRDYVLPSGKQIDIYCPSKRIGIEYCGLYWHNELSPQPRMHAYHHNKMKEAEAAGIRLVTLFEDEWECRRPQAEHRLKAIMNIYTTKIGARVCELTDISTEHAQQFIEANHLQGAGVLPMRAWQLRHAGETCGVLTLARHHRQGHDASIVLSRLAYKHGVMIVGGASRLIQAAKTWAREQKYEKLISWSDNRWSQGNVYQQTGFHLAQELSPDYTYVDYKNPATRLSKQSQTKKNAARPAEMSRMEWVYSQGLARIWDCGHKRWEIAL
jgi:hypothetical protein